jgi:two-component system OmpR family sensor kinase
VTLRRRLVLAMSVAAVIVVGSTVVLLVILRASLRDELDGQLFAATRELVARADQGQDGSSTPTQLTDLFVGELVAGGEVSAAARPAVAADELPRFAPEVVEEHATDRSAPFEPFDASAGDHDYRVTAVRVADERIVVAALPTDRVDATFRRVALGSAAVGLSVLTAMALLAWWVERLGLRPIRSVTAAADSIASGATATRVDPIPPCRTEAGHLARAFNVMVDERQASEDRLRRFVADASHELRTPLTTVTGVCDLFRSGSLAGPELDEAMRRAGSEANRMTRLVDDLLLLTQLDHGLPLADDDVDLAVLVNDAAVDIGLVQPERPVTVEAAGAAIVRGDEARLRQVIGNLVNNALTHTPAGAALRLVVHRVGDAWVVEVRDEGPGLTADQAEHVFDRFYRVAAGRSRREGTGLGLSIVQSIVAAHGGQVSLTAVPGRGCSFRVELPSRLPANFQGS